MKRIFCAEFKKLFFRKGFWLALVFILLGNAAVFGFYLLPKSEREVYKTVSVDMQLYSQMEFSDASRIIEGRASEMSQLMDYYFLNVYGDIEPIQQWEDEHPELIKLYADTLLKDSSALLQENSLVGILYEQNQYMNSYPKYIQEMKKRADTLSSVSVFSNENTFAYRNIQKTVKDFSLLENLSLKFTSGDAGFKILHKTEYTDFFAIVFLMLMCVTIFQREKDHNLYAMIKTTRHGKYPIIISKLAVLGILAFAMAVLLGLSNIFFVQMSQGFGSLDVPIQSMATFRNCNIQISARQYLVIVLLVKGCVTASVGLLVAWIFQAFQNEKIVFALVSLLFVVSYISWIVIPALSTFNWLKYINIFAILNIKTFIADYKNLNLFGFPVNFLYIGLAVLIIATVIAVLLNILWFCSELRVPISFNISQKSKKIKSGSTNLFLQELRKVFIKQKVWIIIAFSLLFCISQIENSELEMDLPTAVYKNCINQQSGKMSPEKLSWIENRIENTEQYGNFESDWSKGLSRYQDQLQYLSNMQEKGFDNLWIIDEYSSDWLFNNPIREFNKAIVYCVLLIFALSSIFAYDTQRNLKGLIKTTHFGYRRLTVVREFLSFLIAVILLGIVYLPDILLFCSRYSVSNWNASLQSIMLFKSFNISISIKTASIICLLMSFMGVVAVTILITTLSQVCRRTIVTIVCAISIIALPLLLKRLGISGLDLVLFNPGFFSFSLLETKSVTIIIVCSIIYASLTVGLICFNNYAWGRYKIRE